mmetsp:Transcript_23246/g.57713  ORF Transcript_23246/g.57713 Transcript_23246/m.57713 type:complete len:261 (+) Transcript_23246:3-785(+)
MGGVGRSARLDRRSVVEACEGSLRRLGVEYVDLFQIHWPDRYVPLFGKTKYRRELERKDAVPIMETLRGVKQLLDAGKIRAYGLSNESTFGICEAVRCADLLGMPRPASVQNSYSLLHRQFESEMAEACSPLNFNIGLMPWSVLAGGALTGKYLGGEVPEGSRQALFPKYMRRFFEGKLETHIKGYEFLAAHCGVSLATLAIAFCRSRWFVDGNGSCIIGATKMNQLRENIDAYKVELSDEVLESIDELYVSGRDLSQAL